MARRLPLALAALALALCSCASTLLRTGTTPRIDLVEVLEVGETRRGQVLEILGPPDGVGRSRLPVHSKPQVVWNYLSQDSDWDTLSRYFLALFFDDQVLTGYLWYTVEDLPVNNAAPVWLRQTLQP